MSEMLGGKQNKAGVPKELRTQRQLAEFIEDHKVYNAATPQEEHERIGTYFYLYRDTIFVQIAPPKPPVVKPPAPPHPASPQHIPSPDLELFAQGPLMWGSLQRIGGEECATDALRAAVAIGFHQLSEHVAKEVAIKVGTSFGVSGGVVFLGYLGKKGWKFIRGSKGEIKVVTQDGKIVSRAEMQAAEKEFATTSRRQLFGNFEYVVVDASKATAARQRLLEYYNAHAPKPDIRWVGNISGGKNAYIDTKTGAIFMHNDLKLEKYKHLKEGVEVEELYHFQQLHTRGWLGRDLSAKEINELENEVVGLIKNSGFKIHGR